MGKGAFTGVIHCFTASQDFAHKALELGLFISISGIVTFKNARDLQDTASRLPGERLLIETDAPFLAPVPKRGKPCERSEEHTSELQSLMRISYAVFCLKKTKQKITTTKTT